MKTILYSGTKNASSWAMRAFIALREAGVAFEERVVDIRRPQRYNNLAEIGRFSPTAAVPVLVVNQEVIFDSLAIMEWANEMSGGRLLPQAIIPRAQARSLMAWQHSGLSNICPRISFESAFYSDKRALSTQEHAQSQSLFHVWETHLERSLGPFLFGDLSLADLNFLPTVVRLRRHQASTLGFPRVETWMMRVLELASVQEWMAEADKQPHVWYDDYFGQD